MCALTTGYIGDLPPVGGVRRSVWTLLIAAVMIAVLAPAVTIWRAAHAEIVASACVWPAAPTVGHPAELRVPEAAAGDHPRRLHA